MYTFKQVCELLHMSEYTLRHYTDSGLLRYPKRDHQNRRIYDEEDIEWLRGAQYLRSLGFSIKDIRLYHEYASTNDISLLNKQLDIFQKNKEIATQQLKDIQNKLKNLDKQIQYITGLIDNHQIDMKSPINKKYKNQS